MALELPWGKIPFLTANSDYSSGNAQFKFVKAATPGFTLCGSGDPSIGILQDTPALGEAGDVLAVGVSKIYYGGTVAFGDALQSDASGNGITQSGGGAVLAIALEAGVSGELRTVLVSRIGSSGLSANYSMVSFPVKMANIANGDIVKSFTPGFAGQIVSTFFVVKDPTSTAAKASTLNWDIGTTPTTGGAIALTTANTNALGNVVNGSAVTAANSFLNTDTLKLVAASTTAFVEGEGEVILVLKSAP